MFFIGGFLTRKHLFDTETEEELFTKFPDELQQGGLSMSTLLSVNFVFCTMFLHHALLEPRKHCGKALHT